LTVPASVGEINQVSGLKRVWPRRLGIICLVWLGLALADGGSARATTIAGGNVINQTWSPAGSPYVIQGDIVVPVGASLTIQAGTVVQFASSDGQAAGLDATRIELTVNGALTVSGTATSPVTFQAQSGTAMGIWYGVVVGSSATSTTITGAVLQNAAFGVVSQATGNALSISSTTARTNNRGFDIEAGTPSLDRLTATANVFGLYVGGSAAPNVTGALIYGNSSYGIYDVRSTPTGTLTVTGATIDRNGSYGVYAGGPAATINVKNSIVTNHTSFGIIAGASGSMVSVTNSDVWNNAGGAGNFMGAVTATATFSCNPLFVSSTNLRLTANSPARFSGDTGNDLGALPYVSDASAGLLGTLWSNTDLTVAGSPYALTGDLTVPPGVTLTIEPGVTLSFATSDAMLCGADANRTELTIAGTLAAIGTPTQPVKLTSPGTVAGSWYGVNLTRASSSTLDYVTIERALDGVLHQSSGANTIRRSTFQGCNTGLAVASGTANVDAIVSTGNVLGVALSGSGQLNLTNSIVKSNSNEAVDFTNAGSGLVVNLINCTFDANGLYGVFVGSATMATINVTNTIVANHGYGFYIGSSGATVNVTYSDVWNNSIANYTGTTAGVGCVSQNPNFVNAPSDLHLLPGSVCIDTGTATGAPSADLDGLARPIDGDSTGGAAFDMGAYEFRSSGADGGTGTMDGGGGVDAGAGGAGGTGGNAGQAGAGGTGGRGGNAGQTGAGGTGGGGGNGDQTGAGGTGGGGSAGQTGAGGTGGGGGNGGQTGAGGTGTGGGNGGQTGAGGTGGTHSSDAAVDGGEDSSVAADAGAKPSTSSGCSCRVTDASREYDHLGLVPLGMLLVSVVRRSRSSSNRRRSTRER